MKRCRALSPRVACDRTFALCCLQVQDSLASRAARTAESSSFSAATMAFRAVTIRRNWVASSAGASSGQIAERRVLPMDLHDPPRLGLPATGDAPGAGGDTGVGDDTPKPGRPGGEPVGLVHRARAGRPSGHCLKVMAKPPAVQLPALAGTTSHVELFDNGVVLIETWSLAFVPSILYVSWAAY